MNLEKSDRDWRLPSDLMHELNSKNYCIVDEMMSSEWADNLLHESKRLAVGGHLLQHRFQFGKNLYEKPHIFELDLFDKMKREKSLELSYIYDKAAPKFISMINERDAQRNISLDETPSSIKLQLNKGGSFPYHYDNTGIGKRAITCIIYLNPDWKQGDGGELVLWPFLGKPVSIPPKHQRAVIFKSDMLLHRVMPSNKDRYCFTIWCDGGKVNAKDDVQLSRDHLKFASFDEAEKFFCRSPLQRVISRAVYDDEYLKSLLECVGGTDGEEILVQQHKASVAALEAKLRPLIEEFRRRKIQVALN